MIITEEMKQALKEIWDYTGLDMSITKSDLIIGCGCANMEIPVTCSLLWKKGYAKNILFTGGLGKVTKQTFQISEAEMFRNIAIKQGIPEENIFIENQSTNTGDNFRYSLEVIEKEKLKADRIIIVHSRLSERRTFCTAKKVLLGKALSITSPVLTFEDWIQRLEQIEENRAYEIISVAVGDIQRMIIFPQFGWQIEQEVPEKVIDAYTVLKKLGFTKYVFHKKKIEELIDQFGLEKETDPIYWN